MSDTATERFWQKVDKVSNAPCWVWTGALNAKGYGNTKWHGVSGHASRISMLIAGHTIAPKMVVDHLCKNRACVNPAHLRVADYYTNSVLNSDGPVGRNARKTHCPKGHALIGDNLDSWALRKGWRGCKLCRNERKRQVYHARNSHNSEMTA